MRPRLAAPVVRSRCDGAPLVAVASPGSDRTAIAPGCALGHHHRRVWVWGQSAATGPHGRNMPSARPPMPFLAPEACSGPWAWIRKKPCTGSTRSSTVERRPSRPSTRHGGKRAAADSSPRWTPIFSSLGRTGRIVRWPGCFSGTLDAAVDVGAGEMGVRWLVGGEREIVCCEVLICRLA